jgi:dihydrofolate reductase
MSISIIVAVSQNNIIGKDNQLIWRLPDDLKRFKSLTLGHPIIMGRKTFDSIGKPLPGRTSIVITRDSTFAPEGVWVAHSIDEAIQMAQNLTQDEVFIIGGGDIYKQTLPIAQKIFLTTVNLEVEGDTTFEITDLNNWEEVRNEHHTSDEKHAYSFNFIDLVRVKSAI